MQEQWLSGVKTQAIVAAWSAQIEAARAKKEPFSKTAKLCEHFFCASMGFMWESGFRRQYLNNMPAPQFQITIAKGFELVSIIGPSLMWDYPGRESKIYDRIAIDPLVFGSPDDPMAAEQYRLYQQEEAMELGRNRTRAGLMTAYQNYAQREQSPSLTTESHMAIIEALVKGRGCLRVDTYQPPGTPGVLTGAFYVSTDDLLIDPDCQRADLKDAKWIAIRHFDTHYDLERMFGWREGSLANRATTATPSSIASSKKTVDMRSAMNRVEWYEVFSKCGVGTRFNGTVMPEYHRAFEQTVGDYARICFVKGMDSPLNLQNSFLEHATPDDVQSALDWPIPYYMDNRWPIAFLDFWVQPNNPWPIAPMAMGLGELTFMNVFMSSLLERVYRQGVLKMGVVKAASDDAVQKLKSLQHEVLEINTDVAKSVRELVDYLEQPSLSYDVFRMLDYVSMMFDKRVGLMELMYGLNPGGKVSRSAADANMKGEAVSVRPDWMSRCVESWQTEVANLDRIAAGWNVRGETLVPLFGRTQAALWDQLIANEDPVIYVREMRTTIEADSIRKPNKSRDNANLQSMSGYMLPMLQWYASQSGGDTRPLNAYVRAMGKAMGQDVEDWSMDPITPPQPDPEQVAAAQESQAMEAEKSRADLNYRTLKANKLAHEMLGEGAGLPVELMDSVSPLETLA